jgi:hypothetical protein
MGGIMNTYRIKVRGTTYLWGGTGIKFPLASPSPLFLVLRVEPSGETVEFGKLIRSSDGPDDPGTEEQVLGLLRDGESYTVDLSDAMGLFARVPDGIHTFISYSIIQPNVGASNG